MADFWETDSHKKAEKKLENWQISIEKLPKSALSQLNLLIYPRLRFFPNIATYLNDAPYCLLPASKKLDTFNGRFLRKCPKSPIFDT